MTRSACRRIILCATLLCLGSTLSACTGGGQKSREREYATPRSLCGVAVPAEPLESLLPPGKEIDQLTKNPTDTVQRCVVSVDGDEILRINQEWWEKGVTAEQFAADLSYVEPGDDVVSGKDGTYAAWEKGAVTRVECRDPGNDDTALFLVAHSFGPGTSSDAATMRKFIAAYAEGYTRSKECEGA